MNGNHYTADELLGRLYGVGPQDAHLDHCPECRARWEALQSRRARLLAGPELDPAFLARQRAAILERAARPRALAPRLAPAYAAALLLVMAVFLTRPVEPPVPALSARGDSQVFAEAYALLQRDVPRAGLPIQALFEEQQ